MTSMNHATRMELVKRSLKSMLIAIDEIIEAPDFVEFDESLSKQALNECEELENTLRDLIGIDEYNPEDDQ